MGEPGQYYVSIRPGTFLVNGYIGQSMPCQSHLLLAVSNMRRLRFIVYFGPPLYQTISSVHIHG